MYFMTMGGQKTILKGKGTVRMTIRDPFHWQVYRGSTVYSDIDVTIFNKWDTGVLRLALVTGSENHLCPQARRRANAASDEQQGGKRTAVKTVGS
jgi:iron complex outermembrane receptor protein